MGTACRIFISLFLVLSCQLSMGQGVRLGGLLLTQEVRITGRAVNASDNEPLAGAHIYSQTGRYGTATDADGGFSLNVPSGRAVQLIVSFVGYETYSRTVDATEDVYLDIRLTSGNSLPGVEVYAARKNFGVESSQMGATVLSIDQISSMPSLLGESDVLKTMQKLPGVQSASDGGAGIMVRGGEYDQNLIMLDGVPVYSAEHLRGYTSAFNPDVVDYVTLYKGAFPARYGSRLSSVVDIGMREGDFEHFHGQVGVGLLSSKVQLEGPIIKGRTSFNLSARASYFNWIVEPALKAIYVNKDALADYSHMNYYDLNAKVVHRVSANDKISVSFYKGQDVDDESSSSSVDVKPTYKEMATSDKYTSVGHKLLDNVTKNHWGNTLGSLAWTHQIGSGSIVTRLGYSRYKSRFSYATTSGKKYYRVYEEKTLEALHEKTKSDIAYESGATDLFLTSDFRKTVSDVHDIRAGVGLSYKKTCPHISTYTYQSMRKLQEVSPDLKETYYTGGDEDWSATTEDRQNMYTVSAYAEDDVSWGKFLKTNIGIRASLYGVKDKSFIYIEPRISLRLLLRNDMSLKLGYARMTQGIHQLASGNVTNQSDLWVTATRDLAPSVADQYSVGYSYTPTRSINISAEVYYKKMDNLLEYMDGMSFASSGGQWQNLVAVGHGKSYGAELMLEKSTGVTTGWISYTYSRSLRTFDNPGMELNAGREFKATTDRPHNFNIVLTHQLGKHWDFSLSWTYQSGRRGTLVTTVVNSGRLDEYSVWGEKLPRYSSSVVKWATSMVVTSSEGKEHAHMHQFQNVETYKERNGYKMPDAHHLDISLDYHISHGWGESVCNLSIYNVYNRQNVSNVYVGYEDKKFVLKGVCRFPIMPSVSYTLKF